MTSSTRRLSPNNPLPPPGLCSLGGPLTDAARRPNGTINRRLMSFLDLCSSATPSAPYKGVTTFDVTVDQTRNLWFLFFVPSTTSSSPASLPVVVFFHGGGFSFLSPDSYAYDAVCRKLAREIPAVVVSVKYHLSPEHGYPCQYDDGLDVLKFLDQNPDSLLDLADCSRCFLAGDSAGENIAHHVAVRACSEPFRVVKPIGLISIQKTQKPGGFLETVEGFLATKPKNLVASLRLR